MTVYDWHDYDKWSPQLVCWVELSNGEQMQAYHVGDAFETLDGELIETVSRWKPLRVAAITGVYEKAGR